MATKEEQYNRAKEYLDYLKAQSTAYTQYLSTFIPDKKRQADRDAAFAKAMSDLGYKAQDLPQVSKRFRDYSTVFATDRSGMRPEKYAESIVKQADLEKANASAKAEADVRTRAAASTGIPPYRTTPETAPVFPVSTSSVSERLDPLGPITGRTIQVPKAPSTPEAPTPTPTPAPATAPAPAPAASQKRMYSTPYGMVQATPEQAQRIGAFDASAEGLAAQALRSQRLTSGRSPIANIGGLSDAEFQKQLQAGTAPITREELDARDARIRQLEDQSKAQAEASRANTYLNRIETLRKNRADEMTKDRKKFAEGKKGDKAFAAKWNSPMYRSIIDQPSVVSPEYTGKRNPKELSDWFKAKQASFVPMTATLDPMTGIAERGMDRAIRQQDAEARQLAIDRGRRGVAVPGITSSQGRQAIIGANIAAADRAAQQAQEGVEQLRGINSTLATASDDDEGKANLPAPPQQGSSTNLLDDFNKIVDRLKEEEEEKVKKKTTQFSAL